MQLSPAIDVEAGFHVTLVSVCSVAITGLHWRYVVSEGVGMHWGAGEGAGPADVANLNVSVNSYVSRCHVVDWGDGRWGLSCVVASFLAFLCDIHTPISK